MTIERESFQGPIEVTCDFCPDAYHTHCSDWASAKMKWERNGWRAGKLKDEWVHYCPACYEAELL